MMKLMHIERVKPHDYAKIETPFFACHKVERAFFAPFDTSISFIDDMLDKNYTTSEKRTKRQLEKLLEKIARGEVVLIHQFHKPFSPVFRQKQDKSASPNSTSTAEYEMVSTKLGSRANMAFKMASEGFYSPTKWVGKLDGNDVDANASDNTEGTESNVDDISETSESSNASSSDATEEEKKFYQVVVEVRTRAGNIPIKGLPVSIDGAQVGMTNNQGNTSKTEKKDTKKIDIKVSYKNDASRLKEEVFTLQISGIDLTSKNYSLGKGKNHISKVQNVLGSGTQSLSGDLDFTDEYTYPADQVSLEATDEPNLYQMKVIVKMATFSLDVPYLSQVGSGETVTIQTTPTIKTKKYKGSKICMPTSTTMLLDYWNIKTQNNSHITRNNLMQKCWDDHTNPSSNFPTPWQDWSHLRKVTGTYADEHSDDTFSVTSGPTGADSSIPSQYANAIMEEVAKGFPVVTSTFATAGHVMVVRGGVIDNKGDVQWLILNDPYGNLASEESLYGELEVSLPVGLRGNYEGEEMNLNDDLVGVREALTSLGFYSGDLYAAIDENDPEDQTIKAIKSYQGGANADGRIDPDGYTEGRLNNSLKQGTKDSYAKKEEEVNTASGENSDRGKHVYYNNATEARGVGSNKHFILKGQAWTLIIEQNTPLTEDELVAKITTNA
jgi:hypothetical protein